MEAKKTYAARKKPKMLFLDDRTRRIHSALRQFSEQYDVTIVTNVKECLRCLAREDYAVVSMDHDLRGVDFEDPDSPECGMEVVRYLEKTGWPDWKEKPPRFYVHSSNVFAANLMINRLRTFGMDANYVRFQYDEEKSA